MVSLWAHKRNYPTVIYYRKTYIGIFVVLIIIKYLKKSMMLIRVVCVFV